jgi:hypothetical protein
MRMVRLSRVFLLLTLLAGPPAAWEAARARSPQSATSAEAPSDEEIRARTKMLLANQHADDEALELYERQEHQADRTGGANPRTISDKVYRIIPTGVGNGKILLRAEGKPTDPALYARQLRTLEELLETMANPDDPRAKTANAKFQRRMRERAQFVDAASEAYTIKWVGREHRNGRDCDVFELDPNPGFQPRSMFQQAFAHTTAKLWVDRTAQQIVHAEASVTSDVLFGGGLLGKLYRGSVVSLDQAEIAPGIWLPARYQYEYAGRKFLFTFDEHQVIEVNHYRRIGPPKEALQTVQNELSSGKTYSEDP